MGQAGAQLGHLVDLVHATAGQVVQPVEVVGVRGDGERALGGVDRNDRLEDRPLALLDPLAHRVEVGGEVDSGGEEAAVVLALALAVELLPPLANVVQLGVEIGQDLDLLALAIERLAGGGVAQGGVTVEGHVGADGALHLDGATDEGADVDAGHGDGQQPDGREDGVSSADVVRDDVGLVSLAVSQRAEGAPGTVGHGHDALLSGRGADVLLEQAAEDAESDGRLGRGAGFGDIDDTEVASTEQVAKLAEVILADLVAGVEDDGVRAVGAGTERVEAVREGFDHGACAEVAATDADHYDSLAGAQPLGRLLDVGQLGVGDGTGQVEPAEEVVAGAGAFIKGSETLFGLWADGLEALFGVWAEGFGEV